jgi:hypothetical protein
MDLISVAQQTGEVSADAYTQAFHEAGGMLPPPHMAGIEDLLEQMRLAEAESNPFAANGAEPAEATYAGAPSPASKPFRPPAIIPPAPSPSRSMVRTALKCS